MERLSRYVTGPNHAEFRLLTVARRSSCESHKVVVLVPHLVVGLVLQVRDAEKFPQAFADSFDSFFSESGSRVHFSQL